MIGCALRMLASLGGALAVLAAGAWAGGAFSPARASAGKPARASGELDYAAKAADSQIEIGDAIEANGQPLQLSVFYTSDAPTEVARFYTQAFQARHLLPITAVEDRVSHVSAFDPDDGLQRFINAVAQPDGQTLVMVGVTNPRKQPHLTDGAASASFPVPEQNRAFLGYRSEDAGSKAETGQFVTAQSPAEVSGFYRKELAAQGWTERRGDSTETMLLFEKGGETLSVALQALDAKQGAAVFVNRLREAGK
jgi:hypothetical protein